MSEYITIIEKSPIEYIDDTVWLIVLGILMAIVIIPTVIHILIIKSKGSRNYINAIRTELTAGAIALIGCILFVCVFNKHFLGPSFRYI